MQQLGSILDFSFKRLATPGLNKQMWDLINHLDMKAK